MAKEEFHKEESPPKKKAKEVSAKSKKSVKSLKTQTKAEKDTKASKKPAEKVVVAKAEEEKDERLMLDITWVAIAVFVFFFLGFWVRGFMIPSTVTTNPQSSRPSSFSGSGSDQSSLGVCPVTGKSGQGGPITGTTGATPPRTAEGNTGLRQGGPITGTTRATATQPKVESSP